jgi:nicotinamidase-related amidase
VEYLAPDFRSVALVTIDIQADTLDGQPLEVPGTSAVVPRIAALAAAFRDAGRPIVHIVRLYREDASNVDLCRRAAVEAGAEMFVPGSSGSQLAPGVVERPASFALQPDRLLDGRPQEVGPQEVVMYKPRWGAFYETPLEDHLRRRGVSTIVFCGCNFPNCPRTSIYEASERDFRVVLVEDAISGLYDRGREELEDIGVGLMPAADVITSLRGAQLSASAGTTASRAGSPASGATDSVGSPVTVSPDPTG